ncbi:hypothetical protein M9H77_22712 [Catharanthus roseus]|uniref:Uncharacterized protein n=1 Tax=Catharanthus roseus TaxID=4058 RepID=A0ACC0ATE5_CATRO|nr:hypothetical protein M9H77_22712 [Catharanthus roseus]
MSSMSFEGDKREEIRESCCDISSQLNSLSSEEKFEAGNMENEGILGCMLYKTISFLHSTSLLIQSQFFYFLTTICGIKLNHGLKAKGEGMGKELSIGYEDTSIKKFCDTPNPYTRLTAAE